MGPFAGYHPRGGEGVSDRIIISITQVRRLAHAKNYYPTIYNLPAAGLDTRRIHCRSVSSTASSVQTEDQRSYD